MDVLASVGPQLLVHDGQAIVKRSPGFYLGGKVIGFYFSAHWCPPCRQFTPQLASVYRKLKARGVDFEVVFVSSDRSPSDLEDYFKSMPWTALPFEAARGAQGRDLASRFSVAGIPRLVLVGVDGQVLSNDARGAVMRDPEGQEFPWKGAGAAAPAGWASNPALLMLLFILAWALSKYFTNDHERSTAYMPQ